MSQSNHTDMSSGSKIRESGSRDSLGGSIKRQQRLPKEDAGLAAGPRLGAADGVVDIGTLPDSILGMVFDAAHRKSHSFTHAIVCRHWKEVAFAEQHVLFVKPAVPAAELDLLEEVNAFSSLTSLHIGKNALWKLTNRLLAGLPKACPHLRKLRIRPDASRRAGYPSVSGLHALVSSLPGLTSIMFESASYVVKIKDKEPFPPLTGITSLDLAEGGYGKRTLGSGWGSLGPVLPVLGTFTALRRLSLQLKNDDLVEAVGQLRMLTNLTYKNYNGDKLPSSLGELTQLQKLEIVSSAICMPASCSRLNSLTWLSLRLAFTGLPSWIGEFRQLETLKVIGSFTEGLTPQLWSLTNLTTLHISSNPLDIPDEISNLRGLQNLKLWSECPSPLPESLAMLLSLTRIEISNHFTESLLPHLKLLTNLRTLHLNFMFGDGFIYQVPYTMACLPHLRSLHAYNPWGLARYLQIISPLPALKSVVLYGCTPDDLNRALRAFRGVECAKLHLTSSRRNRQIASGSLNLDRLKSVVKLHVEWHNMTKIQDSISKLTQLKDLSLERGKFSCLPESLSSLLSLEKLELSYCFQLARFPDSFGALPKLATLSLLQLRNLRTFPESFRELQQLRTLAVLDCRLTKYAFDHLPASLRMLTVRNGFRTSGRISSRVGELENLRILELSEHCLVQVPDSVGGLRDLRQLRLFRLRRFSGFPDSMTQLTALRDLDVELCPYLHQVPARMLELPLLSNVSKRVLREVMQRKPEELRPQQLGDWRDEFLSLPDNGLRQDESEDESDPGADGNRAHGQEGGSGTCVWETGTCVWETGTSGDTPTGVGQSAGDETGAVGGTGTAGAEPGKMLTLRGNQVDEDVCSSDGESDGGGSDEGSEEEDEDNEEDDDDGWGDDEDDYEASDDEEDDESDDDDDNLVLVDQAFANPEDVDLLHKYEDLGNE